MGCYTPKKCSFEGVEGLIWTTSTQHLITYIKVLKFFLLKFILRYLHFKRSFANFLHQNAFYWLIWYLRAHTQVFIGSIAMQCQNVVLLGRKILTIVAGNVKYTHKTLFWSRFWLLNTFFLQIYPQRSQNTELLIQVTPLVSLGCQLIINLANGRHFDGWNLWK